MMIDKGALTVTTCRTAREVAREIAMTNWSTEDLKIMYEALNRVQDRKRQALISGLFPSMRVSFRDKSGDVHEGTVQKVNRKTVIVREMRGDNRWTTWRVSPNLLTVIGG